MKFYFTILFTIYIVKSRIVNRIKDPTGEHTREFDKMDIDKNRTLSVSELHAGMTTGPLQGKYNQDQISTLFDQIDVDGDKNVTLDEYLNFHAKSQWTFEDQVIGFVATQQYVHNVNDTKALENFNSKIKVILGQLCSENQAMLKDWTWEGLFS